MASSPITSRKIDGEKMETVIDSIFLGFKITAGEGNGSPLQHSCLENPVDGGAWWAAVHHVAESDTTEATASMHALEKEMATHSSILA